MINKKLLYFGIFLFLVSCNYPGFVPTLTPSDRAAATIRLPSAHSTSFPTFAIPSNTPTPTLIEFEALPVLEKNAISYAAIQDMSPWGAQHWSGGRQVFLSAGQGSSIKFDLSLIKMSEYNLQITATKAPDYGRIQVLLDNQPLGQPLDLYDPAVRPSGVIILGSVKLNPGSHVLTFSVIGKNDASSGYSFGIDSLLIPPADVAVKPPSVPNDQRYVMPVQDTLPWGAIGFIDNGCTGTLIDRQHVLAAAHCFIFDYNTDSFQQGDWQPGLVFFPNYNPAIAEPQRIRIDRVVVGTRVQTGAEYVGSDWGIAHLAEPVDNYPALAIEPSTQYPLTVTYAGYARHEIFFPFVYPQPDPGGFCKYFGSNCWWTPALVEPSCRVLGDSNRILHMDSASCPIIGGNSGSPILWNAGSPSAPDYRITGVIHGSDAEPAAERFLFAPRFASAIALANADDGSLRTQVFAGDSDLGRVVSRTRVNVSSSGGFDPFGRVGADVPSPRRLTAFTLANKKPVVAAVSADGGLYVSGLDSSGARQAWQRMDAPGGTQGFLDAAASYDSTGAPQLYVIAGDHRLYVRHLLNNDPYAGWDDWAALLSSSRDSFQHVAAVRRSDGSQTVFLVNTADQVLEFSQTSALPQSAWSAPASLMSPGGPAAIAELTVNLTEDSQIEVFAIDKNGGLWTRIMKTASARDGWEDWKVWSMALFAPVAVAAPVLKDLVSLTAGQWQETAGGVRVPVVFATDRQGNIYYTIHIKGQGWRNWLSFYQ